MRILIDIDSTVADTLPYWLDKIYERTGIRATIDDIKEWDLRKSEPLANVPGEVILGLLDEPGFYENIPAIPGATWAITQLWEDGHELTFVTARGWKHEHATDQWLHDHFPRPRTPDVWFDLGEKRVTVPHDVLIDDCGETQKVDWLQQTPTLGILRIGVAYPYNAHACGVMYRIPRSMLAWVEIYDRIQGFRNRYRLG